MSEQVGTAITGIRTVGVPVADQDRALEFYVGVLGFEKRMDMPLDKMGGRWIEVAPKGAETSLALVPEPAAAGVETGVRLVAADAAALHRELGERGVTVGELMNWPGVPPMFEFKDLDGNGLVVVQ